MHEGPKLETSCAASMNCSGSSFETRGPGAGLRLRTPGGWPANQRLEVIFRLPNKNPGESSRCHGRKPRRDCPSGFPVWPPTSSSWTGAAQPARSGRSLRRLALPLGTGVMRKLSQEDAGGCGATHSALVKPVTPTRSSSLQCSLPKRERRRRARRPRQLRGGPSAPVRRLSTGLQSFLCPQPEPSPHSKSRRGGVDGRFDGVTDRCSRR